MSRKTPIKELLSEENVDSAAPIRRSSRISLSQNSVSSPAPKSVVTRRSSANGINEKNKEVDVDTDTSTPTALGRERRKTRRTSTEEEIKPTPVKTRRGSVSKIIEEEKKVSSSPNTPTRKINTRAVSTSPSAADVPARRTRRSASASQETEVIEEQLPVRRSTRRRSFVDTQEDATNEENLAKSKPTTRRRRSTSVDENEESTKNEVKQKTKRLYSDDNQLEPIEEHETEVTEKPREEIAKTSVEIKKGQDLSVIEESDDTETEESNKILKDIDDVLKSKVSSPKNKSISIFSPMTSKTNMTEQKKELSSEDVSSSIGIQNELVQKNNAEFRANSKAESGSKLVINEIDCESEVKEKTEIDSKTKAKNASPLKNLIVVLDKGAGISPTKKGSNKVIEVEMEKISKSPGENLGTGIADKPYITMGSDDSFTLNLNMSLDKTQFPEKEEADDDVFTSPGSNKENSSINIPRKSLPRKNEDSIGQEENSNRITAQKVELDVFASKKTSRYSFLEPMDVDCELESPKESSKIGTPKVMNKGSKIFSPDIDKHKKIGEGNRDYPEVQKATSSEDTEEISVSNYIFGKDTEDNGKTANESLCESTDKTNIDVNEKSDTRTEESEDNIKSHVLDCSSTISNTDSEKSSIFLNAYPPEDKIDSSFNMLSPDKSSEKPQRLSNYSVKGVVASTADKNEYESEGCVSSDVSIRIVDTDDEIQDVVEDKSLPNSVNSSNEGSKQLRKSDITSTGKQLTQMKKDDKTSEAETSISVPTNNSLEEQPEDVEESTSKDADKQQTESIEVEMAAIHESPKSKYRQPNLEENESIEEKNSLGNFVCMSLEKKDNESKLDVEENEFRNHSPKRRSLRQSLKKKPQEGEEESDGREPNSDLAENTSEGKSSKIELENNRDEEVSDNEEPMPELKVSDYDSPDKLQMSENSGSEPRNSETELHLSEKSKRRQSLKNSPKKIEIKNNDVEADQIETKLMNSSRKSLSRKSLNENFDDEEIEAEASNEKEKIKSREAHKESKRIYENNESSKRKIDQKEMQELISSPEIQSETEETGAIKTKNNKDDSLQLKNNLESSAEEDTKSNVSKILKKPDTGVPLNTRSRKSYETRQEKNSDVESENYMINMSLEDGANKAENSNKYTKSNNSSDGSESETAESNQKLASASVIDYLNIKKCDNSTKNTASPLKSKMDKMKACGVNFVNPSPTASRLKLDKTTSDKLDNLLTEKFGNLQNEETDSENDKDSEEDNSSEDENTSEDFESKSGFLDDMAEEGEEDTPSEGSNDIIDEGESINSTESEIVSDESYDSNDSFLVKDDDDNMELLSGEEYDLEIREEFEEQSEMKKSPKRRRIIRKQNTSSEEESAFTSPRVSFSEKVEVIPKKKTPVKQIAVSASPRKTNVKENTDNVIKNIYENDQRNEVPPKETFANVQTKISPRKVASFETPSIYVDLIDDSSNEVEEEEPNKNDNSVREKSAFEERIRSLVEGEKSSTPNSSFHDAANTSRQNTSARSSSIIVHENVSIGDIKDGFLAEKLQQVVNVFCAGIRTSDGNISMNVSLDYVENTPSTSVSAKKETDEVSALVEHEQNLPESEERARTKSRHSLNRSEENKNDSISRVENSRKRRSSNVFTERSDKESCPKIDIAKEIISTQNISVLDASFDDENSVQDDIKTTDSGSSKKKRRSSTRKERRLSRNKSAEVSNTSIKDDYTVNTVEEQEDNKMEDTPILRTEEIQHMDSSKKKRRSSIKMEKRLSELNKNSQNTERSFDEEKSPTKKLKANSDIEESSTKLIKNKQNCKSQSTEDVSGANEEKDANKSEYDQITNVVNTSMVRNELNAQMKKKKNKANKKRKHDEETWSETTVPELMTSKRMKMPEIKFEELSSNDLRHRLPSRNEMSGESNTKVKSKKLKRLQSKLKSDIKSTLLSGLVTDVKNRPRRLMKPSVQMNDAGWLVEEHLSKPSSANVTKCTFNFKKIDDKDFKNQMLYDPRIKRESTSSFLRKKGYFL